jgi:two-component system chemotaxis sensor kinase CheA
VIAALNALAGTQAVDIAAASTTEQPQHRGQGWKIRFRPHPELLSHGGNPVLLLNELREMGECDVIAHTEELPLLEHLEPDHCYVWWEIDLHTERGINAVRDVFLFVEDTSEVLIEPLACSEPGPSAPAERAIASGTAPAQPVLTRTAAPSQQRRSAASQSTVRVASEKLDALVNLVGELVMNQSRLTQAASKFDSPELAAPVEEIERLVAELRDNALGIRMMPIGTTFTRFRRLVHDLSAELGKDVDLVTEGAETELGKTVLDQLGDPLVHLIRNSIDHGLEAPEQRLADGKSARGTIRLSAVHTGSNVVVSVQDDGRGLDVNKILAKALERHLIPPDANLQASEIFNLIFLPGFSTAEQVSGVSGRRRGHGRGKAADRVAPRVRNDQQ